MTRGLSKGSYLEQTSTFQVDGKDITLGKGSWLGAAGSGARAAGGAARAIANVATRSAIDGSSFGDNLMRALPDTIRQIVGEALGNELRGLSRRASAAEGSGSDSDSEGGGASRDPVSKQGKTVGELSEAIFGAGAPVVKKPYWEPGATGSLGVGSDAVEDGSYNLGQDSRRRGRYSVGTSSDHYAVTGDNIYGTSYVEADGTIVVQAVRPRSDAYNRINWFSNTWLTGSDRYQQKHRSRAQGVMRDYPWLGGSATRPLGTGPAVTASSDANAAGDKISYLLSSATEGTNVPEFTFAVGAEVELLAEHGGGISGGSFVSQSTDGLRIGLFKTTKNGQGIDGSGGAFIQLIGGNQNDFQGYSDSFEIDVRPLSGVGPGATAEPLQTAMNIELDAHTRGGKGEN